MSSDGRRRQCRRLLLICFPHVVRVFPPCVSFSNLPSQNECKSNKVKILFLKAALMLSLNWPEFQVEYLKPALFWMSTGPRYKVKERMS